MNRLFQGFEFLCFVGEILEKHEDGGQCSNTDLVLHSSRITPPPLLKDLTARADHFDT